MNLIVSAAIVLLNPYVTVYISYKIPPFALSVHIPGHTRSLSGSILRHKISLKSAILYPFIP